ncbi:hypothetical protein SLE2022_243650 [Rubroshorea leprosula]
MTIKLHGAPMSTCTAKVLTCLHEKGIDFEFVPVNLLAGEQKQPSFVAKNPFGLVPVLEDGDFTIILDGESGERCGRAAVDGELACVPDGGGDCSPWRNPLAVVGVDESRAITSYLAEKFKDSGCDLIGHGNIKESAMVKVWMEVESQQYSPAVSPIFFQYFIVPKRGGSPDQAIIDENSGKLGKVLDVYEQRLSGAKYLAGDFFSLADLHHLGLTFYFMKTPCARLINERPHVKAWWEDISSRPAFQKVVPGMTLGAK